LSNIVLRAGGGQNHDGDPAEVRVRFDLPERLTPIHPGHIQIEQDETRTWCPRVSLILPPPVKIVQQRFSIIHEAEIGVNPRFIQGLQSQKPIVRVVIDHQDRERS
jgi:hypothetical protein